MTLLRARAMVALGMFGTSVSLPVQAIRLAYESQHWIALLSWTVCTFLFIAVPVVVRLTGSLDTTGILITLAILVGSVGVAVTEGGVASPNAMVMLVAPVLGSMLGGRVSGAVMAVVVALFCGGLWFLHAHGLIASESTLQPDTLVTMRATLIATIATAFYLFALFYENERDRSAAELSKKANELAIAREAVIEAAAVKIELLASQGRELEQDLQLTAAVQKLLLPKRDCLETEYMSLAGFSVPAKQAGGDWWFSEVLPDGTLRVLLGDVTGHGAAPAMVSAVVAGAFRALQQTAKLEAGAVLEVLHQILLDVSAGTYTMPFGILELSPSGRAKWTSAAASPVLILRRNGDVDTVAAPGTALGSDALTVGQGSFYVAPGERILLSSDGVPELRMSSGHELGLRRLSKLIKATREAPVEQARDEIVEHLNKVRGDTELNDDITFALIERRCAVLRLAHG